MAIDLSRKNELKWVKEGRVFTVTGAGVLTTPGTFQTDLVRQTPDLLVRAPSGIVIVPLRVQVSWEATDTAVIQCLISACNNDPGIANMVAVTPVNSNSRYAQTGSSVTAYNTNSGASGTPPTNVVDVFRSYVQPRVDNVGTGSAPFEQVVYAPLHGRGAPCIVGGDTGVHAFMVYPAGAGIATGYILAAWAEFTYVEFYAA